MIERKTTELCYFLLMLNLHLSTVSIITLMTVWRMTGKVIRTTIMLTAYARRCTHIMEFLQF